MRESWTLRDGKPEAAEDGEILLYTAPTPEEKDALLQVHGIDSHLLESCLDDDELPRMEQDDDMLALVLKRPRPHKSHDGFLFKVASMGIFQVPGRVIVVCNEPIEIFSVRRMQSCHDLQTYFILLIYQTTIHFLEHMKVIRMIADSIEGRLNHTVENRGLMDLYTLEKGLVYYLNAVSGNQAVLERIRLLANRLGVSAENCELLEDISIESGQCYKLAEIQSSILDNMIETHASISSNNLNVLMKRLTVLSVVFMPLNLLAGIGGMSEWSAFTSGIPPLLSYTIVFIIMIAVGFLTYKILSWTGLGESSPLKHLGRRKN